jgi:quercetin dioxygenase-like cupin family protein
MTPQCPKLTDRDPSGRDPLERAMTVELSDTLGRSGVGPGRSFRPMTNRRCEISAPGLALLATILLPFASPAGEPAPARHPDERDGTATLIHRADVIRDQGTNDPATPMRLWPVLATPEARMNYVEVTGRSSLHFHPDADHKLYVLEGKVVVTAGTNTMTAAAGDLIIIPKGVRHGYDVPARGERALLLTFDAPPYDPKKTVPLESPGPDKRKPSATSNPNPGKS